MVESYFTFVYRYGTNILEFDESEGGNSANGCAPEAFSIKRMLPSLQGKATMPLCNDP
jgi:hypothetical protein